MTRLKFIKYIKTLGFNEKYDGSIIYNYVKNNDIIILVSVLDNYKIYNINKYGEYHKIYEFDDLKPLERYIRSKKIKNIIRKF